MIFNGVVFLAQIILILLSAMAIFVILSGVSFTANTLHDHNFTKFESLYQTLLSFVWSVWVSRHKLL